MLRHLVEFYVPSNQLGFSRMWTIQTFGRHQEGIQCTMLYFMWISTVVTVIKLYPRSSRVYVGAPAIIDGFFEFVEFSSIFFVMEIFMRNVGFHVGFLILVQGFFHLGGTVGAPFFALLSQKTNRKISGIIANISGIILLIVLVFLLSAITLISHNFWDRTYVQAGELGNRRVREIMDPNEGKILGGAYKFENGINRDMHYIMLVVIFLGFALSNLPVSQTIFVDVWGEINFARTAQLFLGFCYWDLGLAAGTMFANACYLLFGISGFAAALSVLKTVRLASKFFFPDSKGVFDREFGITDDSKSWCWVKAIYGALYYWPQGQRYTVDMTAYMLDARKTWRAPLLGMFCISRTRSGRCMNTIVFDIFCRTLYLPTAGYMIFSTLQAQNSFYASFFMDLFNVNRFMGGHYLLFVWHSLYASIAAEFVPIASVAFFLGVCDSMRHVGSFLALGTYPLQLYCGDPMNCWRTQYLYSHAVFYNFNGNGGNQIHFCWYVFVKGQKRQCCCPYRKLKADAPEKCCPPCCLGPLVEDSGGCPCPCCCASCSG